MYRNRGDHAQARRPVSGLWSAGSGVGISLERVYSMTIVALLVGVYGELLTVVGIGMIGGALWKKRPSHEN